MKILGIGLIILVFVAIYLITRIVKSKKVSVDVQQRFLEELTAHGMISAVFTEWIPAKNAGKDRINHLVKVLTYEEHLKKHGVTRPYVAFILEHSDKEKVAEFDRCVHLFNSELETIKLTHNTDRAWTIAEMAMKLK